MAKPPCANTRRHAVKRNQKFANFATPKITRNENLSPQSVYHRRMRFLTSDEARRLLEELKAKSVLWHDIALFALQTGLRAGEIYALRPFDVDVERGHLKLYDTKNGSTRIIPLNVTAKAIASVASINFVDI